MLYVRLDGEGEEGWKSSLGKKIERGYTGGMNDIVLIAVAALFFFLFRGAKSKPKDDKGGKGGKPGDKVGKK